MTTVLKSSHLKKSSCCVPNLPGMAWAIGTGAEDEEPEGGLLGELKLEKVLQEESRLRRRSQARRSDLDGRKTRPPQEDLADRSSSGLQEESRGGTRLRVPTSLRRRPDHPGRWSSWQKDSPLACRRSSGRNQASCSNLRTVRARPLSLLRA